MELFKGHAVVVLKQAALTRFRLVRDFATGAEQELTFPEPVYFATAGDTPEFDTVAFRFSYQSLVVPPTVYDEDLAAGTRTW